MIIFKQQTKCPAGNNLAFITADGGYGGKNHCILGNPEGRKYRGSVLPNCTGYVRGRVIQTIGSDEMLPRCNAENYWKEVTCFPHSQVPKVGSIACWAGGKAGYANDGCGHVQFVESVNSHGDYGFTDSGWTGTIKNGRYWRRGVVKRVNGTYAFGSLKFQGFIHVFACDEVVPVENGVYRLWNPNSYEHFYTTNIGEANSLVRGGWSYEQIGWLAPKKGTPVFRLYNPNDGDHVFTAKMKERLALEKYGWRYECVAFFSDDKKQLPVRRFYKEHEGHMYTTDAIEIDALRKAGWDDEGIAFYAMKW